MKAATKGAERLTSVDRRTPAEWTPFATISGRQLASVYVDRPQESMGPPGEYPYTRGIHPEMYRSRRWTMRMFAGFGAPEDTNGRFRYLLSQGQSGLSTAFDMPTLMGYDPDHAMCLGEVGREGVSMASVEDMSRVFDGIDLAGVSTSMTISGPAPVALAMFIVAAERSGVSRAELRGTLQTDILKEFIAQKEWVVPERPSMRLVTDLIEFCTDEMPRWHPISVSGYHIREAGSTAAQELAFTLANGIAYVQALVDRGVDPDRFLPRFSFFFNFHIDFFEEVAKIRAARRIWASLMRDRFGAVDHRSWQLRTHIQTSGVSLTAQQPLLNIARTAIEALGAVMAGTQSLHTNAYDETMSIPTEESATLALRTQQLIAEETGVANVADPLGGSYFVESLTDEMERQAEEIFAYLDEIGGGSMLEGVVKGIEENWFQGKIADSAYELERNFNQGRRIVVGVNRFTEGNDDSAIDILQITNEDEARQIKRLAAVRHDRDNAAVEAALAKLATESADPEVNLVPTLIETVDTYATLGEIMNAMAGVFGRHVEVPTI